MGVLTVTHNVLISSKNVCFYPMLQDGIPEDGDEFVDFRSRVVELVKDVVFIVGSSSVFAQVSCLAVT